MLKLGFTLPKFAKICLHKSTNHEYYLFVATDKVSKKKLKEIAGGPSVFLTKEAVVDQNCIRS